MSEFDNTDDVKFDLKNQKTASQASSDQIYKEETLAAIREGIESGEHGELKPAVQVFEEMKAKDSIGDPSATG